MKASTIVMIASLLLTPVLSYAEAYLCLGEAASGVRVWKSGSIQSETFNPNNIKYIHSKMSGEWVLKNVRTGQSFSCETEFSCDREHSLSFIRHKFGTFTVFGHFGSSEGDPIDSVVAAGRCTRIDN
jgi:hypothetical protein